MRKRFKTGLFKGIVGLVGGCLLASTLVAGKKVEENPIHPFLRVPEMQQAPKMDGKLSMDEWKGSAVFTGVSGSPLTTPFMLPESQQVIWYLGFYGDKVYIGMKSPHPKGTFPKGRIKEPDNQDVLFEDHVEVQLCKYKPIDATRPGRGFWKMVINPWGAMHDRHWYNGTPDSEDIWSTGGEVKCYVTDSEWQMEMSVAANNMNLKKLDGQKLLIQLVRASDTGGIYFAGWVGTHWVDWAHFAECDFDSKAPTIQFNKLGEIMEGSLDTDFMITGNSKDKIAVDVELLIENADGKIIYKEVKNASVGKNEKASLKFQKSGVPISEVELASKKRNYFQISATYKDGKKKRILYFNRSPFMKLTPEWKRKYLDPWVASRQTAGEWEVNFSNWIYSEKALAKVDIEFFGVKKELLESKKFIVEVKPHGKSEVLAKGSGPMSNLKGEILFDMPDLKDGKYDAVFALYDSAEKKVGEKTILFERKRFPFEHNSLGKSDEVIPPFWPLSTDVRIVRGGNGRQLSGLNKNAKNAVKAWGRVYEFSGNGLLKQILTTSPTGACGGIEALLASPMKIELKSNGKNIDLKESEAPSVDVKDHRADISGKTSSEVADINVKGFEEYDGWYEVEMDIQPKNKSSIESLDIVFDMRDEAGGRRQTKFPVDTFIAQRLGMGSDSYYGGIPRKPGVHFKSTSLSGSFERAGPADIAKDWKSFVPVSYIGNGSRGLYFFAWSDIGWKMKDNDPVVTVERLKDGNVRFKVRIISDLKNFDKPRKVRFAIQATPIKANDPQYRNVVDSILHDTSGYRYYGESVDGYCLNKDEDYDALRKHLLYDARWSPRVRNLDFSRLVLYGSQWMTGCGSEEFDTYGGEWLGSNNWKPDPDLKFADRWNMQHTNQWKTPKQLSPRRVNWSRSMLDFFIWYYNKHITKSGINGTWWDNCYSGLITEYDPEIGKLDSKWNFYFRRQLCKRLNVMGWQNMRRPCWLIGTPEMELSWCQVHWMVEGFWYSPAKNLSIWQNWDIDFMRAQIRPKGSVMISKAWLHGYEGTTPKEDERVKRSVMAVLLLHDLTPPAGIKYSERDEIIHRLKYVVDYDNTSDCLYMAYWNSSMFVKPSAEKGVLVSYYQNAKRKSAVLVFANTTKKDIALGGTKFSPAGIIGNSQASPAAIERPLELRRVYDLESGREVKTTYRDGWLVIDEPMVVERDGFRLLALEAAK